MTDEEFNQLWQRAEAESYAARLAQEYPAWRTRQRHRAAIVAAAAVMLAVAVPVFTPSRSSHLQVVCNRSGMPDAGWVDLASAMLLDA